MSIEIESLHQRIVDNALVAIGVTDPEGRFILVNSTWCTLLGYTETEAMHLTIRDITPPDDLDTSDQNYQHLLTNKLSHFQKLRKYVRKDGTTFWANLNVSSILNQDNIVEGVLGIFIDIDRQIEAEQSLQKSFETLEQLYKKISQANLQITNKNRELKAAYHKLDELARLDELTRLPNRRELENLISIEQKRSIRNKRTFTIAIGDIDDFKKVNDTYGHDAGDAVLREIARTLQANIRTTDFMGRWGGEEFLFILPETDCEGADIVMGRIRKAVSQTLCHHCELALHLTMTFGFSVFRFDNDINVVVKEADLALYYGKLHGKNQAQCYDDIEEKLLNKA